MNIERWVAKRRPVWQELEELVQLVNRQGLAALERQQLQSLGRLYRCASADLSRARALNLGTDVVGYLNRLVVRAHNQVYQSKRASNLAILDFFWSGFPALVRQNFAYIALAVVIFWVPAIAAAVLASSNIEFAHMETAPCKSIISEEMWDLIENKKMWTDEMSEGSPVFAASISTNNIKVCILAFAMGITAGLGTVWIIFSNGLMLGTIYGACQYHGMSDQVLEFIVGHGSLELPAIFIAGGAGLLLGSGMLFPGQMSRADAFRKRARPALGMFGGCVPILLIAGIIESFISPRHDVSAEGKMLVGAAAFLLLILYLTIPRKSLAKSPRSKAV